MLKVGRVNPREMRTFERKRIEFTSNEKLIRSHCCYSLNITFSFQLQKFVFEIILFSSIKIFGHVKFAESVRINLDLSCENKHSEPKDLIKIHTFPFVPLSFFFFFFFPSPTRRRSSHRAGRFYRVTFSVRHWSISSLGRNTWRT